jgi:DNA-binding NarL/FixJ family response regulator
MDLARVLLADDHRGVAEAMGKYVAEAFQLVGTVRDGDALLEAAHTLKPDVIVADISMPGMDGLSATRQIRERLPHTRVILLTNYGDPVLARHALDVGASGFVLKVYASTELVQAIRMVLGGGTYVSSAIAISGGASFEAAVSHDEE